MNPDRDLTRRQVVRVAGAAGAAYVAGPALLGALLDSPAAVAASRCARLTPELTEGPYWVNEMLRRSDVRANTSTAKSTAGVQQQGVPLNLTINVYNASNHCSPLNGVAVDIWHANAHGLYSDESSQQSGGGTTNGDSTGQNFLRDYQVTGHAAGFIAGRSPARSASRRSGPGGTQVARSTSTSASACCQSAAQRSPATQPRSSSPTPTTIACSPALSPTTAARPRRIPPRMRTTRSCKAPRARRTSCRSPEPWPRVSRRRSTSCSHTAR